MKDNHIKNKKEKSSWSGLYKPLLNFFKIDDQIAVIDPHRNLIVESIGMRLVTFFKEIAQDRFCLRIYNPIFTYAGILVFHAFLFIISFSAGWGDNLNAEIRCAVYAFFHDAVTMTDDGNVRLEHRAVITVKLHI